MDDEKKCELQKHAQQGAIPLGTLVERHKKSRFKRLQKIWEREMEEVKEHNDFIEKMERAAHIYLFLYVSDTNAPCVHGLYMGKDTYTIDLRKALPSTFLRPCSQHGWIVRGKNIEFDFNTNVACVIRISVNLTKKLLGNGMLLSQENFFPNDTIDQGYRILLERQKESRLKTKHTKIIEKEMIIDLGE